MCVLHLYKHGGLFKPQYPLPYRSINAPSSNPAEKRLQAPSLPAKFAKADIVNVWDVERKAPAATNLLPQRFFKIAAFWLVSGIFIRPLHSRESGPRSWRPLAQTYCRKSWEIATEGDLRKPKFRVGDYVRREEDGIVLILRAKGVRHRSGEFWVEVSESPSVFPEEELEFVHS